MKKRYFEFDGAIFRFDSVKVLGYDYSGQRSFLVITFDFKYEDEDDVSDPYHTEFEMEESKLRQIVEDYKAYLTEE